jgi:hypothetical protein
LTCCGLVLSFFLWSGLFLFQNEPDFFLFAVILFAHLALALTLAIAILSVNDVTNPCLRSLLSVIGNLMLLIQFFLVSNNNY